MGMADKFTSRYRGDLLPPTLDEKNEQDMELLAKGIKDAVSQPIRLAIMAESLKDPWSMLDYLRQKVESLGQAQQVRRS